MTRYNQQRKLEAERKRDADLKKQKEYEELRRKEFEKEEMEAQLETLEGTKRRKDKSIRWMYEKPFGYLDDSKKDEQKDGKTPEESNKQDATEPKKERKHVSKMEHLENKFDFMKGMPKSQFGPEDTVLRHYPLGREVSPIIYFVSIIPVR